MKRIVFILNLLFAAITLIAQVPAGFSYQAVIRNSSGDIVANQTVKFQFSILRDSESGTVVYRETHSVPTNNFGLANLKVGMGNKVSGTFDPAAWGNSKHYLKVELDPDNGNSFSHLGTSKLLAVPYAFHAQTVAEDQVDDADADPMNEIQFLSKSENMIVLSNEGGSVIDEVNDEDADPGNEIQILSFDGTELILSKGGGTVQLPSSGLGDNWGVQTVATDETLTGLGIETNPLRISDGGVTSAKILDGSILSDDIANFMVTADKLANNSVTTEKINAGAVTGIKIAQAGATNGQVLKWDGSNWLPGTDLTGGSSIWTQNGSDIYYNTGNVGIGVASPRYKLEIYHDDYSYIKFFNSSSGIGVKDGFVVGSTPSGNPAWLWNYENGNMHFGTRDSNRMIIDADGQISIMKYLDLLTKGSGPALFVKGKEALWWNGIYFSWGYGATFNYFAKPVGIKTTTLSDYELVVNGEAAKTGGGSWSNSSDIRLKDILGQYSKGLNDIIRLQPVRFKYKENNIRDLPSEEEQIGFVAQEVQKVFPEAINMHSDGYLDFNIHSVNVALVNAVKELKIENDLLKERLEKLEQLVGESAYK